METDIFKPSDLNFVLKAIDDQFRRSQFNIPETHQYLPPKTRYSYPIIFIEHPIMEFKFAYHDGILHYNYKDEDFNSISGHDNDRKTIGKYVTKWLRHIKKYCEIVAYNEMKPQSAPPPIELTEEMKETEKMLDKLAQERGLDVDNTIQFKEMYYSGEFDEIAINSPLVSNIPIPKVNVPQVGINPEVHKYLKEIMRNPAFDYALKHKEALENLKPILEALSRNEGSNIQFEKIEFTTPHNRLHIIEEKIDTIQNDVTEVKQQGKKIIEQTKPKTIWQTLREEGFKACLKLLIEKVGSLSTPFIIKFIVGAIIAISFIITTIQMYFHGITI